MPESIRDGKGRGYLAAVNQENKLNTQTVQESLEHHANSHHGDAYNIQFSVTPTGAGDCFLYIKNSSTYCMLFEGISIYAAAAEKIYMQVNDVGTPAGGVAIIPANLNSGSSNTAIGTFLSAADITGLSGGTQVASYRVIADGASHGINFEADFVLTPNTVLTVWATTGTALLEGYFSSWFNREVL